MKKKLFFLCFGLISFILPNIAYSSFHPDEVSFSLELIVDVDEENFSFRPLLSWNTGSFDISDDITGTSEIEILLPSISIKDPISPDSFKDFVFRVSIGAVANDILFAPEISNNLEFNVGDFISGSPACSFNSCLTIDPGIGIDIPLFKYQFDENGSNLSGALFFGLNLFRDDDNLLPNTYNKAQLTFTNVPDVPLPPAIYGFISGLLIILSKRSLKFKG